MTSSAVVFTRQVGSAAVAVINEGTLPWAPRYGVPEDEWRRAFPDAGADLRLILGLHVVLMRTADALVVVDPGCDAPASAWQRAFAERWPGVTRTGGLDAALCSLGIEAAEVTHVLITHAHEDHFGGVLREDAGGLVPRFPNARHLLGRADWEGNPRRGEPGSVHAARLGAIERHGVLELVDGEHAATANVSLVPAPGESPGHCMVRLTSGGETCYCLGDLVHHACEVEHPDWIPGQTRDAPTLLATRRRLFARIVAERALCMFAHAPFPAWGRIEPAGGGYRWTPEVGSA